MKIFSCLIAVTYCQAGTIPKDEDYHHELPNLSTVYHGHGATSYQYGHIKDHQSTTTDHHAKHNQYELADYLELDDHPVISYQHAVSIKKPHVLPRIILVSTIAPYKDEKVEHEKLDADVATVYYDQYDHDFVEDYEYH
ncbi:uncharacterized protein LOC105698591 [Orussus abietinus]|uniref:uncharacterized protein LOC105698591 n=1 Tax=Orussus abietinus TaxID=222816 RepID=UPI0006252C04|nr:uncharacterized protein LOC105698591 [Orussus abietinus]